MKVADVSPGTRLMAGFTGKIYTVRAVDGDKVYVRGLPPVRMDELQKDIANGKITVLN